MKNTLIALYRSIFTKPSLYQLNLHLFKLQLRGIGLLNSESEAATGEPWFLQKLAQYNPRVVVDVGANDRAYGHDVLTSSYIFAIEPHPDSFARLCKNASKKVIPIEAAVGNKDRISTLWDFADHSPRKEDQATSQLATLHPSIISNLYKQPTKSYSVREITLDSYFKDKKIKHIDLLKIDAEGNELAVLQGAKKLLQDNKIQIIQFEFNETHAYSHVLMKDFYNLLSEFSFYRLLPNAAVPLGEYRPLTHELFGFQNIVAVHKDSRFANIFS